MLIDNVAKIYEEKYKLMDAFFDDTMETVYGVLRKYNENQLKAEYEKQVKELEYIREEIQKEKPLPSLPHEIELPNRWDNFGIKVIGKENL